MKQREIKFRAWNPIFKEMIYDFTSDLYHVDMQDGKLVVGVYDGNNDWIGFEIMQYTGLKDKNGKEIYEGDIIQTRWYGNAVDYDVIGVVEFKQSSFMIVPKIHKQTAWDIHLYHATKEHVTLNAEIIGNVFENLEKLNK